MADRYSNYRVGLHASDSRDYTSDIGSNQGRRQTNKKRHLVWFLNFLENEDGSTIVEALMAVPVLVFLLLASIEYFGVLTIYQHTESLKYYTLSRMELNGGLMPGDEQYLIDHLIKLGADPKTIKVGGTVLRNGMQPVKWPGRVVLTIQFMPEHFNGFLARTLIGGNPDKPLWIGVKGSEISQKA